MILTRLVIKARAKTAVTYISYYSTRVWQNKIKSLDALYNQMSNYQIKAGSPNEYEFNSSQVSSSRIKQKK